MYENNLKQIGVGNTTISTTHNLGTQGLDVLSTSQIRGGKMYNRNHLPPDIIVTSKGCGPGSSSSSTSSTAHHPNGPIVNSHKNSSLMGMHNSATMMDIKSLQKSNTFASSLSSGGLKIGSWFDRRARKISMKCSKSMTLGKTPFLTQIK